MLIIIILIILLIIFLFISHSNITKNNIFENYDGNIVNKPIPNIFVNYKFDICNKLIGITNINPNIKDKKHHCLVFPCPYTKYSNHNAVCWKCIDQETIETLASYNAICEVIAAATEHEKQHQI